MTNSIRFTLAAILLAGMTASFLVGRYVGRYDGPIITESYYYPPMDWPSLGVKDDALELFGGVMEIRAHHKQTVLVTNLAVIENDGLITITGAREAHGASECEVTRADVSATKPLAPDLFILQNLILDLRRLM